MCGRYYIPDEDAAAELMEIIDQINRKHNAGPVIKTGEIAPSDTAPVLANNRNLVVTPFAMKWGYSLDNGRLVINARSEEAAEKSLFRDGMAQRRCLVPAAHYYEWETVGKQKVKYAIQPSDSSVMYMAGIYRIENGAPVFSILTREPASSIAFIHDRMPVILPRDLMNDWLNPRYNANEVLRSAVLDVSHTLAGPRQERLI